MGVNLLSAVGLVGAAILIAIGVKGILSEIRGRSSRLVISAFACFGLSGVAYLIGQSLVQMVLLVMAVGFWMRWESARNKPA